MPHRTPCPWSLICSDNVCNICSVCKGWIHIDGAHICPFIGLYDIKPDIQHLITADERFYSISQRNKMDQV